MRYNKYLIFFLIIIILSGGTYYMFFSKNNFNNCLKLKFQNEIDPKTILAPYFITYSPEDKKIYLIDYENIKVYTEDGKFLQKIGAKGKAPDEYLQPANIIFDKEKMFVLDAENKKIILFDRNNNYKFIKSYSLLGFEDIGNCLLIKKMDGNDVIFFTGIKMINTNQGSWGNYLNLDSGKIEILPNTISDFKNINEIMEALAYNIYSLDENTLFFISKKTSKSIYYSLKNKKIIKEINNLSKINDISDPELKKMAPKLANISLIENNLLFISATEKGTNYLFDINKNQISELKINFDRDEDTSEYISVAVEKKVKGKGGLPVSIYNFFIDNNSHKCFSIINMEKISIFNYSIEN